MTQKARDAVKRMHDGVQIAGDRGHQAAGGF